MTKIISLISTNKRLLCLSSDVITMKEKRAFVWQKSDDTAISQRKLQNCVDDIFMTLKSKLKTIFEFRVFKLCHMPNLIFIGEKMPELGDRPDRVEKFQVSFLLHCHGLIIMFSSALTYFLKYFHSKYCLVQEKNLLCAMLMKGIFGLGQKPAFPYNYFIYEV